MNLLAIGTQVRIIGSKITGYIAGYATYAYQTSVYPDDHNMHLGYLVDIGPTPRYVEGTDRTLSVSFVVCHPDNVVTD